MFVGNYWFDSIHRGPNQISHRDKWGVFGQEVIFFGLCIRPLIVQKNQEMLSILINFDIQAHLRTVTTALIFQQGLSQNILVLTKSWNWNFWDFLPSIRTLMVGWVEKAIKLMIYSVFEHMFLRQWNFHVFHLHLIWKFKFEWWEVNWEGICFDPCVRILTLHKFQKVLSILSIAICEAIFLRSYWLNFFYDGLNRQLQICTCFSI